MSNLTTTSSSICGISIGTENCYVAIARQGGIEILLNEYSQRSTPAYIAFGGNQREIGVSAKQKQMMNIRNTCFAPTSIINNRYSKQSIQEIPYRIEPGPNDEVLVKVEHGGEELVLTPVQVLAMLFTKLRQISGNAVDCVINCPNHFDYIERRAMMQAAQIAGLNPLRVISDMTAIALYYGFYRTAQHAQQDYSVIGFVDCGQTTAQAAIVLFDHKENILKVLDAQSLRNVGGKYFDELLGNFFIEKHGLKLNERSRLRLYAECEKLKKNLSANPNELPINIECLYDEQDFSSKINRKTFEEIAQPLLDKIAEMLHKCLQNAKDKFSKERGGELKLDGVEVVGGTCRIPAVKRLVKEFAGGLEPSTTLNADEAVARGCALQCAILSPTFKVQRELVIHDVMPYDVYFRYQIPGKDEKQTLMYPRGHPFPYTKQITITSHTLPIMIAFDYIDSNGQNVQLAQYRVVEPPGSNATQIIMEHRAPIKIRVKFDASCLLAVQSATVAYELDVPSNDNEQQAGQSGHSANPNDNGQSGQQQSGQSGANPNDNVQSGQSGQQSNESGQMDVDQASGQPSEPTTQHQTKRKKPKTVTIDLVIEQLFMAGKVPEEILQKYQEFENNMILADKNWKEKMDARNALEEFIYEWRDRMECGEYDPFINDVLKQEFQQRLMENERWLYEQDEQGVWHSKSVYEDRTSDMASKYANGILRRRKEFDNRPRCLEQLGHQLQLARKVSQTPEEQEGKVAEKSVSEADEEELKKFIEEIESKQKWFDDISGKLAGMKTYDDPLYSCDDILKQVNQLQQAIQLLQNNRKKRAEERKQKQDKVPPSGDGDKEPAPMDVDPAQQGQEQEATQQQQAQ